MFNVRMAYRDFLAAMREEERVLWDLLTDSAEKQEADRHGYPYWRVLFPAEPTLVYADWLEEQGRPEAFGYRTMIRTGRVLLGWAPYSWSESSPGDGFYWSLAGDQSGNCWDPRNELPRPVYAQLPEDCFPAYPAWEPMLFAAAHAYANAHQFGHVDPDGRATI